MRWALLALLASGCGVIDPSYLPPPGEACDQDSDCVPNDCCGKGTAIVHKSHAPDCTTVKCDGSCPVGGIKCGCAVPVCRDSRCTSAISPSPEC